MKHKISALGLSLAIIMTNISPAFASENKKEEVVYINTKENGNLEDINIVNIFPKGNVKDYGNYSNVKLLNSDKNIENKDGVISFESDKDRIYYQGKSEINEIPWDINIIYYLNGKEIKPDDLKAKDGKVKIRLKITKNPNIKEDFYENYALQINTQIDTEKNKNLEAKDATLANEGKNKLITYTALPGKGLDKEISFDTKDFSFSGFSINAVKLNIDVDLNQKDLDARINELIDATKKLNDSSKEINNKSNDLKSASSQLNSGIEELSDGNIKLSDGINSLSNGIETVQNGLTSLSNKSESLNNGSDQILYALKEIKKSLDNLPEDNDNIEKIGTYSSQIKDAINQIDNSLELSVDATNPKNYQNTLKANGLDTNLLRNSNEEAINQIDQQITALKQQLYLAQISDSYENTKSDENKSNDTKNNQDTKKEKQTNTIQEAPQEEIKQEKEDIENKEENLKNKENNDINAEKSSTKAFKTNNQTINLLNQQIVTLENTKKLLQANNSNIDANNKYMKNLNDSFVELKNGAYKLNTNYDQFDKNIQTLSSKIQTLLIQSNRLYEAIEKIENNYKILNQATHSYTNALDKLAIGNENILNATKELQNADNKLIQGSDKLKDGSNKLNDGVINYTNAVSQLDNGINKFNNKTSNMDEQLNEEIEKIKKSLGDENKPTKSFASEKNNNIKSLQFVIQTEKIEKEEKSTQTKDDKKENKNFIDKLKDLFK